MPEFHLHLLHPKLVHFPIAFFMGALGLEIISLIFKKENLHRTAVALFVMATLVTPLVVWSGLEEAEHLNLHHPVLDTHKRFALLTMLGSFAAVPVLWVTYKRNKTAFRIVFLIFMLIFATFVTIAGHNGGRMVYEYGVGVDQ